MTDFAVYIHNFPQKNFKDEEFMVMEKSKKIIGMIRQYKGVEFRERRLTCNAICFRCGYRHCEHSKFDNNRCPNIDKKNPHIAFTRDVFL